MLRTRTKTNRHFALEQLESRMVLSSYTVAPTGNDAAAGTSLAPWKTLQHAADVVKAGDNVSVRAGNYAGFQIGFSSPKSGTASAPITFNADRGAVITSRNVKTADGIDLEGASYVTIQGFTVNNSSRKITRAGIRAVQDSGVVIRNNNIDGCGAWGIFTSFSEGVDIEGNTTSRSATQHGIYVSNSADNPVIRNNTAWGNVGCGIQLNGDVSQGGDGIISGALIEGNTLYGNGTQGGAAINLDGVQNSRVQNNLLYNNHSSGISLFQTDGGGPSSGNVVVNNTILVAPDGRWALNILNGSTGNTVLNNILYNYGTYRGGTSISADSLAGFTSDYNAVMSRFSTDGGDSVVGLAQWQSTTGQDLHSVIATPAQMFVSPSGNDYHLVAGSPVIAKGTSSLAPAYDKDAKPRPSGSGFDIGAYQY